MFCQNCGTVLAADAAACVDCGGPIVRPGAGVAAQLKSVSADAWKALRIFAVNPVGELHNAFQTLGPQRAMLAGLAFGVAYDIFAILGAYLMIRRNIGPFSSSFDDLSVKMLLKLVILGCVPLVGFALASLLTRKIFRGQGSIQADIFIAGAALLPTAVVYLIAGVIGLANFEIILVLGVFCLCYTILLLFTGATKLSAIGEAAAVPAVALIILATAWIVKVIFTAVMF